MNSYNKTEADVFPMQAMLSRTTFSRINPPFLVSSIEANAGYAF